MNNNGKNKYDFPNLNVYLSDSEINNIDMLNARSNKLTNEIHAQKDIFNMNLASLFKNWSDANLTIIIEIVELFSNMGRYSSYFSDIDNTGNWYIGIKKFINDFVNILIKDNNGIYFGITLVLLSFMMYLIQITS